MSTPAEEPNVPPKNPARRIRLAIVLLIVLIGGGWVFADWWTCLPAGAKATYVGRDSCITCHQQQYHQWQGSHHDLAMDHATDETVLGDFDDATIEHFGITSKMFRQDGKFMIHTEGPDGAMSDFEVKYVFGVDPLQQYLVEFDRPDDMPDHEIARLQVLRISWDTKQKRWFYLPPPDVDEKLDPSDDLHWTGIASRWNNMCADCHSTNLQKNYDVETGIYHTTFSEIDVSCETCHGPGSLHVQLAQSRSLFWDRNLGYGLPKLKGPQQQQAEIQTCAPCHSRRRVVCPDFRPGEDYYDYFSNGLLREETYYADGQILDEVYVYGSFIQSKMYHKGIRCTDCHDPHSVTLKHQGNQVCTSCHEHPAGKYDGPAHHQHQPDSTAAACVECHMPETTYMEIDPRRDHSLRVPRPDLSVELGTPNACTRCHIQMRLDEVPQREDLPLYQDWLAAAAAGDQQAQQTLARVDKLMAAATEKWYPESRKQRGQHFAHALAMARNGDLAAERPLAETADNKRLPAIVRATALMELARFGTRFGLEVSLSALNDPDPQVRAAAIANLQGMPPRELIKALTPLLHDPVRLVRTEAARVLAAAPGAEMRGSQRHALEAALAEFKQGQMVSNDRAASHMTMAILYENLGDDDAAIAAYETAIRVEPTVTGPRTNLAALYDRLAEAQERAARNAVMQRDKETAMKIAEKAFGYHQKAAALRNQELQWLARDARLLPDSAPIQYRYGMSLYLHGRYEEAGNALRAAVRLEPNQPEFLLGLALFYKEMKEFEKALAVASQLLELRPGDATYQRVLAEIRQEMLSPTKPTTKPDDAS